MECATSERHSKFYKTHMSPHITISYNTRMYMTLPAVADVLANPSSLNAENNTNFFFRKTFNK